MAVAVGELRPPTPSQRAYADYVRRARLEWLTNEAFTAQQMQAAYQRAVTNYERTIMAGPMGPVTRARRNELLDDLTQHQMRLTDESLVVLRNGITRSYGTGLRGANETLTNLAEVTGTPQVAMVQVAQGYAERELASHLARTNQSGLYLSDAVWRASDPFHSSITQLVEQAVITGTSARDLAKQVDQYVNPAARTATSISQRRDLGLPADVSYQAIRLARTEVNVAGREGTIVGHQISPFTEGFEWHRSPNRPYPCKQCDAWAAGGPYAVSEVPPGHPNCRCYLSPVTTPREQSMRELEQWLAEPASQPHIEDWYQRMQAGPDALATPPAGRQPEGLSLRARRAPAPPPPQPTTVTGAYRPLNSLEEMQGYARDELGIGTFGGAESDTGTLNRVLNDFTELKRQGYDMPDTFEIVQGRRGEGSIAQYQQPWHAGGDDRMVAYRVNPFWDNPEYYAKAQGNYWTSNEPTHVLRHEMGHKYHYDANPAAYERLSAEKDNSLPWRRFTARGTVAEQQQLIAMLENNVSGYAATLPQEFVAEVFAGSFSGKTYPPEVMRLYRKVGGPKLPRPVGKPRARRAKLPAGRVRSGR